MSSGGGGDGGGGGGGDGGGGGAESDAVFLPGWLTDRRGPVSLLNWVTVRFTLAQRTESALSLENGRINI